ncbi:MAG: hypothetical protein ABTQ34_09520 [Bdellovibrionales bacterium]
MRTNIVLLAAFLALVGGVDSARAATIDFSGNHHNMGLVSIGQEGAISVDRFGHSLGEVKGFLPGNSKIVIDYTIAGNSVHSPSFGAFTRLVGASVYNFSEGGSQYFGFAFDQDPPSGNMARGWTSTGGGTTESTPLVLVTADVTDDKHGTITIFNYAPKKAFFVSMVESFLRFGRIIGHYSVSGLNVVDPVGSVPLPASVFQFLLAMAGMFGFAYRKARMAV